MAVITINNLNASYYGDLVRKTQLLTRSHFSNFNLYSLVNNQLQLILSTCIVLVFQHYSLLILVTATDVYLSLSIGSTLICTICCQFGCFVSSQSWVILLYYSLIVGDFCSTLLTVSSLIIHLFTLVILEFNSISFDSSFILSGWVLGYYHNL